MAIRESVIIIIFLCWPALIRNSRNWLPGLGSFAKQYVAVWSFETRFWDCIIASSTVAFQSTDQSKESLINKDMLKFSISHARWSGLDETPAERVLTRELMNTEENRPDAET